MNIKTEHAIVLGLAGLAVFMIWRAGSAKGTPAAIQRATGQAWRTNDAPMSAAADPLGWWLRNGTGAD